jgi:hypothetical protein
MGNGRLILIMIALLMVNVVNASDTVVTYYPSESQFAKCLIIDSNKDDNTWRYDYDKSTYEPSFRYTFNSERDADDWVLFPSVKLSAGSYMVSAEYKVMSAMEPEKFEIRVGKERFVSGMNTTVIYNDNATSTIYETVSGIFTADVTGYYYLGMHAFSDKDRYNLYVKNITVTPVTLSAPLSPEIRSVDIQGRDARVKLVLPSNTTDDRVITEDVGAEIYVDDDYYMEIPFGEYAPGDEAEIEMTLPDGKHSLRIRSYMVSDVDFVFSDYAEYAYRISREMPESLSIPCTIDPDEDQFDWSYILDANGDGNSWQYTTEEVLNIYDPENPIILDPLYRYVANGEAADDWLFLPPLDGSQKGVYEVTMLLSTQYLKESFEICCGDAPAVENMTKRLIAKQDYSTGNEYETFTADFNHTIGDKFYIGVHCTSAASKGFLSVKDIMVKYGDGRLPKQIGYKGTQFSDTEGAVTFVLPTENIADEPLTAQKVYADIYVDDEVVKEAISGAPGETVNCPLSLDYGMHTIKIVCYIYDDSTALYSAPYEAVVAVTPSTDICYDLPKEFALNEDEASEFILLDANSDGKTWQADAEGVVYSYSPFGGADDWLFTPALNILNESEIYYLRVKARAYSATYPEAFELWLGTDSNPNAMSLRLIEEAAVTNEEFESYRTTFHVEEPGKYVVGIHVVSKANMYKLYLKDLIVCLDSDYDDVAFVTRSFGAVYSDNGAVIVDGYEGESLTIIGIDGLVAAHIVSLSGYERVELPAGIYIVSVGGETHKIAVL